MEHQHTHISVCVVFISAQEMWTHSLPVTCRLTFVRTVLVFCCFSLLIPVSI